MAQCFNLIHISDQCKLKMTINKRVQIILIIFVKNHLMYEVFQISFQLIRNRRKIYDDNDFREVVKNFYNLVSEINKGQYSVQTLIVKKISKAPLRKQPQQLKQKNTSKNKQPPTKELSYSKRDVHFRPDQQAQQYFNSCFSQQIMSQLMPTFDQPSSKQTPFFYDKPKPHLNFKRNQMHIQAAYQIYIKEFGSGLVDSRDPTSFARKVMNSNFNSKTQYQEEEKESDRSEKLNKSYEDGKKKPLKELVREFQSDQ
ncbi:unnamed protein product (macronuclear) [Paramecium tetraurelia]|uniref:Uncharacterized protein n=1 Tax=Paramecium tetraurelia TaxID=5888 RepID=A0DNV4_PARTE|nr:uncharacterized protein GSPATT00018917001 [Paramecium tetraurelia]CAK84721.1 unnamed protein product [Paramecium tetraurelia]|eukprot:XP_001452118.1 hypothetical protein (macronuclear) [Paramecium tetraurelia strain d4-2]